MQQLTGMDTAFITGETTTAPLHVSGLLLLDPKRDDGTEVSMAEIRRITEERMYELELTRRRLVTVPMGLDRPYWVDDASFDPDFHLRHVALPEPGDQRTLCDMVERITARPLDRSRPLWETYFIEGMADGTLAILTKVHHAAVDGVGGIELLGSMLDITPEPRAANPIEWNPDPEPTPAELLGRAGAQLLRRPGRVVRFQRNMFESFAELNPSAVPFFPILPALGNLGAAGVALFSNIVLPKREPKPEEQTLVEPPGDVPRTVFQGMVSGQRRFAYGTVALDDIKRIRKAADGVTVNDVILCLVAETLRPWFAERGGIPEGSMTAMVPISLRTEDQSGTAGNQVSMMVSPIYTNIEDPMQRLQVIHEAMRITKEEFAAMPAEMLSDIAEFSTPGLATLAARATARINLVERIDPVANLTVSNVPGPQFPLYAGGARVKGLWPCSAVGDGLGLNVTVVSYDGDVCFGFLGCRKQLDDAWSLVDGLDDAVQRMLAAAD